MSVTSLFGVLDAHSGLFRYCCAGHPHPYVLRSRGEAVLLEGVTSPMLGAGAPGGYEEIDITLAPGDGLFLYTDGIPDASDDDRTIFSHERLADVLGSASGGSPAAVARAVVRAIEDFSGDTPQTDDFTAFACRFMAPGA